MAILPAETTPHGEWELVMAFESDVYIIEHGFGETHRSRISRITNSLSQFEWTVLISDDSTYFRPRRKGKNSLYMFQPEPRSIRVSPLVFFIFFLDILDNCEQDEHDSTPVSFD